MEIQKRKQSRNPKPCDLTKKESEGLKSFGQGSVGKESTRGCWRDDTIKRHPDFVLGQ